MIMTNQLVAPCPFGAKGGEQGTRVNFECVFRTKGDILDRLGTIDTIGRPEKQTACLATWGGFRCRKQTIQYVSPDFAEHMAP